MKNLITIIDEIVKYGLTENLPIRDSVYCLEKCLVELYGYYFEMNSECDNYEYSEFDRSIYPNIRQNIATNFKDFGFYLTINNIEKLHEPPEYLIGDAIDDLNDIIWDLLEVKWRIENNSINNGYEFFKGIFSSHIQEHLLNLLLYIRHKNENSQ